MATWGTWNKGHCQGLWPWWAKGNSGGWRKRHESWASRQQCSVFHVILWFIRLNGRYLIAEDSETSTPDSLAARGFSSPGQPRLNAYCLSRPFTFQAWRWAHLILGESFFFFSKNNLFGTSFRKEGLFDTLVHKVYLYHFISTKCPQGTMDISTPDSPSNCWLSTGASNNEQLCSLSAMQ